jgi:S-formylglutathione hydrolase FrmB
MMMGMLRLTRAALLGALLTLACTSCSSAAAPSSSPPPPGLKLVSSTQLDARLSELTFTTGAVAGPVRVRVLLPADAAQNPGRRYPALYLLHGSDGDATVWTDQGDAEALTKDYGMVVVMPDGGSEGWYTNWPGGRQPRWEDFHIRQLIPWIEAHEPVIAARSERAIAGLSMGGFGALSYAARHPDLFAAAASFSGALDLGVNGSHELGWIVSAEPWGPWSGPQVDWRGHNPADLAGNLRGVALWLAAGTGAAGGPFGGGGPDDSVEPVIHAETASFAARAAALGIARQLDDYGAGGHEWAYWQRDLAETLPGIMSVFSHPAALPDPWSFTATERDWTMRGYAVHAARDRLAFRTLSRVRAGGFTLQTDGPATVTTRAGYARGARYVVVLRPAQAGTFRNHSAIVRASASGRLRIGVPASASVTITRAAA